nr:MAG TPA: hypothetical protein [Caudoviricetes sp.]
MTLLKRVLKPTAALLRMIILLTTGLNLLQQKRRD